jgi:hypothetical protein
VSELILLAPLFINEWGIITDDKDQIDSFVISGKMKYSTKKNGFLLLWEGSFT